MTVDDHTLSDASAAPEQQSPPPIQINGDGRAQPKSPRGPRPKLRKTRFLVVLVSFLVIAGIATVFGVLTSVASDLPQLDNKVQFQKNVDSTLYDDSGQEIGVLAPPNKPVADKWGQISQNMVHAIVSVEDKHFWTDPGIQWTSVARATLADATGGATQGASTIAEEFVKNSLAEEHNRTVLEKLREAGMAFQLVHRWKRPKILTQYLNIIYFGNGAYGIESAARVYFGKQLGYDAADPGKGSCGTPSVARPHMPSCASQLKPYQAALLAGMVANPWAFDPVQHPAAARERRDLALQDMRTQGYISAGQYRAARTRPLPQADDIQQPSEPASAPYFTAWVRPQIISALEKEGVPAKTAQYEAYYGGLKIKLTLNLKMQEAAQNAIDAEFPPGSDGPTASLVSIDNATGEVRAMVSGDDDFERDPFNLATLGYRQPGSSFKIFTLARALESGEYGPDSIIDSAPQSIPYKLSNGNIDHFIVHNDEDSYLGPISLSEATAVSDNTVFAQVGMHVGTTNIAKQAHAMGVRSPISTNPAMIIGGLNHGVSPLDMAHAYETLATGGRKIYNPILGDVDEGPTGIHSILNCQDCRQQNVINSGNAIKARQVVPEDVAATIHEMLSGVVTDGTGTNAAIPGVEVVGKTGTTSNYVDAWFCGWTPQITTCVWVGYANSGKPMLTDWEGGPVSGGDFPAVIWKDYTEQALNILADQSKGSGSATNTLTTPVTPLSGGGAVPDSTAQEPTPTTSSADTSDSSDSSATGATGATGGAGDAGATGGTAGTGAAGDTGGTASPAPAASASTPPAPAPAAPAPAPAAPAPAAPSTAAPPAASSGSGASSGGTGGAGLGG